MTIFLSPTPQESGIYFFGQETKYILQTSDGTGRANIVGSGSNSFQFEDVKIQGDISRCNLLFSHSQGLSKIIQGKIKDCQLMFDPNYGEENGTYTLVIGQGNEKVDDAILYDCDYAYNVQITIKKGCKVACKFISSSQALNNICIILEEGSSYYPFETEKTFTSGVYTYTNKIAFWFTYNISNLVFVDYATANGWNLGRISNMTNSYITTNLACGNDIRYISSTDFSGTHMENVSEDQKIDFDSCYCIYLPNWYLSHGQLQDKITKTNNRVSDIENNLNNLTGNYSSIDGIQYYATI